MTEPISTFKESLNIKDKQIQMLNDGLSDIDVYKRQVYPADLNPFDLRVRLAAEVQCLRCVCQWRERGTVVVCHAVSELAGDDVRGVAAAGKRAVYRLSLIHI